MPSTPVKLIMIGPGYFEIFGVICRFLPYRRKRCIFNSVNSGVTGPNLTRIVQHTEKFMPFNPLKSDTLKLRYCNPFWNGSARMKIDREKADFST